MPDYIAIAKQFVAQVTQSRDDIIGVLLVGSAARGETTAFSDIDLRLVVPETEGYWFGRDGMDAWIEDIYIDAGIVAFDVYANIEHVLSNSTPAHDIYDAVILHDPTGHLTQLQKDVQPIFMESKWVQRRLDPHLNRLAQSLADLDEAVETGHTINICISAAQIFFRLALITLIKHGVPPSSTRNLTQLGTIAPALQKQLCELEGTVTMTVRDVQQSTSILGQWADLSHASRKNDLATYMIRKISWLADQGFIQTALHTAWTNCSFRLGECQALEDQQDQEAVLALAGEWLTLFEWQEGVTREEKLEKIKTISHEMQENVSLGDHND
ncbi:MAG: nucleotidyltransferase domain-containing protein [Chloroflexota bacterium]